MGALGHSSKWGTITTVMNALKTVALLGALSGLLVVGGGYLGGERGLFYGLILALGMNFFSYFFSEKMALMSSGAIRVSETENAEVYYRLAPITKRLCDRMGLPMPKLWVIPEQAPNAFATGRNPSHSSVAVTAGILKLLTDEEIGRRHRPRTRPRQEPRHPDRLHRRNHRERHYVHGAHGHVSLAGGATMTMRRIRWC